MFDMVSRLSACAIFGLLVTVAVASEDAPSQPEDAEEVFLYPIKEDGLWKFINREGKVVIAGPFDYVDHAKCFREGLAAVKIGGKWGFVDKTGKLAIKPQFSRVGCFSEGLASVLSDNKWGYIDHAGKMVIEPRFESPFAKQFSEGLAPVHVGEKMGFIDKTGKLAIKPQFSRVDRFSEGLAAVGSDGKWGYIDRTGKMVIEPTFDPGATSFSEGLAGVTTGSILEPKVSYIDKTGKTVFTLDAPAWGPGPFSEGLACVDYGESPIKNWDDRKIGFVDKKGGVVIDPIFQFAMPFSEGLAAVKIGKKWGFVDKQGKVAIEMKFDGARSFRNGAARVSIGNKFGYIDKNGKYFWKPKTSEYKQIDVRLANATIKILAKGTDDEKQKKIREIEASPDKYAPPVFYALSNVLFREGKKQEGAFWFYAGQIRARFDANRCADVTARQAVDVLNQQFGLPINQYMFKDIEKLKALVPKVVDWDRKTPHNYDHRWINLHGMDAVLDSLGANDAKPEPSELSLPRKQWKEIAEKTRTEYLNGFLKVLAELKKQKK